MRLKDCVVNDAEILDLRSAFIMHDHIKVLVPIGLLINWIELVGSVAGLPRDRPFHVGSGGDALGDDVLLVFVVVATSAADESALIGLSSAARETAGNAKTPHKPTQSASMPNFLNMVTLSIEDCWRTPTPIYRNGWASF